MEVKGEDLAHARYGDSSSLLDSKRMLGRLEFERRSLAVISQVHHGLLVAGQFYADVCLCRSRHVCQLGPDLVRSTAALSITAHSSPPNNSLASYAF